MSIRRNLLKGQTLIEVMVAMAVGVLVLTAITSSVLTSLVNSRVSSESNEAAQYVQQGIEIARSSRTAAAGTYCLDKGTDKLSGVPQGTCTTANINGKYIRTVDVVPGSASDCGITVNKAVVTVKWTDSKCTNGAYCHKSVVSSCVNAIALAGTVTPTSPAPGTPTVNLNATLTTITTGNSTTLSWTSTNASNCTATGGTGWAGTKSASGSVTVSPTSNTTYSIYCTSSLGVNSSTVPRAITVNPLPTVLLTASPTSIYTGNSSNLTWTSTNATGCTASGDWSGAKAASQGGPGVSTGALNSTKTFYIICASADGYNSSQDSVVVTVTPPPPTVNLTGPATAASGATVTLTYTVTNVSTCTKNLDWTGSVSTSGTWVSPALTTSKNYRLTCTGLDSSTVVSPTVHVSVGKTTVVFYPTEDAYVKESTPTVNAGTSSYLQAYSDGTGTNRIKSYLKFNLSSLASTRVVVSANLYLKACNTTNAACVGTTVNHRVRTVALTDTWAESTICWNSSPPPCTGSPPQASYIVVFGGATTPIAPGDAINTDLTTYFADKLGLSSVSINLTTDNTTNGLIAVFSKEWTTVADRPKLTIISEL